jgi:uncharacterized membrane protein
MATETTHDSTNQWQSRFFSLHTLSLILVVIGLLVAGYLSYTSLTKSSVICIESGEFDCDLVQNSAYAKFMGIPVAYLGFATYVVLGLMLLFEQRFALLREYGITLVFGITLFAFLFSLWLVYAQAVLLHAFCQWCLIHEITMTLLFIISIVRLKRMLSE